MGRCSVCNSKIMYNAYKKVKGVIYCLKCVPKEEAVTIMFDETVDADFSKLAEIPETIVTTDEKKKPRKRSKKKSKKVKKDGM